MENYNKSFFNGRVITGLFIIVAGAILLLDNLGFYIGFSVWKLWPVILIAIGLHHLLQTAENRQSFSGLVLLGLGILFLLRTLDIVYIRFSIFWPIILVLIGIAIIKHGLFDKGNMPYDKDYINLSFLMGGGEFKFSSRNLKGGKISAVMGGCTIDLKDADFQQDELVIDTFVMWGGIELRVPDHWIVNLQGSPVLGGMENKTYNRTSESQINKRLTVKGFVIMGGVEIKN